VYDIRGAFQDPKGGEGLHTGLCWECRRRGNIEDLPDATICKEFEILKKEIEQLKKEKEWLLNDCIRLNDICYDYGKYNVKDCIIMDMQQDLKE